MGCVYERSEWLSTGIFLSTLEAIIQQVIAEDKDVTVWQDLISALRRQIVP